MNADEFPDLLESVRRLGGFGTVGVFIDQSMTLLETALHGSLVSFKRMNMADRTATVALRPYLPEHEAAVGGVGRLLDEHPLVRWYTSQPDWSAVRISDVMPWQQFRRTQLFTEVLAPIGACHTVLVLLTSPRQNHDWVYFGVNRGDQDFSDAELAFAVRVQPAFVALYSRLTSTAPERSVQAVVTLTRRERTVLGYLADGLTADAIARQLGASPATVRKHLQNLYAKLGTSDRLGAVFRGRDLGLLHADDLSREFTWNVRHDMDEIKRKQHN